MAFGTEYQYLTMSLVNISIWEAGRKRKRRVGNHLATM